MLVSLGMACPFLMASWVTLEDQTIRVWDLETSEIAMEYHTRSTPISITTHKDMPNVSVKLSAPSLAPRIAQVSGDAAILGCGGGWHDQVI